MKKWLMKNSHFIKTKCFGQKVDVLKNDAMGLHRPLIISLFSILFLPKEIISNIETMKEGVQP